MHCWVLVGTEEAAEEAHLKKKNHWWRGSETCKPPLKCDYPVWGFVGLLVLVHMDLCKNDIDL